MGIRLQLLVILLVVLGGFFCQAQQISVDNFKAVPIDRAERVKDKRVIDLYMKDEGYSFSTQAQDIEVRNGDGFARLIVNRDVKFIKISHPQFGTLNWRIPVSKLKSRKLYSAEIVSPISLEYKRQHQWLSITSPYKNAIVIIDSLYKRINRDGLQLLLPIGKHTIKGMAPFFKDRVDTIELKLEGTYEYRLSLEPYYSYLRVSHNADSMNIRIDNKEESMKSLARMRLAAGKHHLYAKHKDMEYSVEFELRPSEFKEITLDTGDFRKKGAKVKRETEKSPEVTTIQETEASYAIVDSVQVTIKAFDEHCGIYINNEYVKDGVWSGYLSNGDYLVYNKRDGLSSKPIFVHVGELDRLDISLNSPASNYGDLNIESNVMNADIYMDGWLVGRTPFIIKDVDASIEHSIVIRKDGYKLVERRVRITPNDETRILLTLQKK